MPDLEEWQGVSKSHESSREILVFEYRDSPDYRTEELHGTGQTVSSQLADGRSAVPNAVPSEEELATRLRELFPSPARKGIASSFNRAGEFASGQVTAEQDQTARSWTRTNPEGASAVKVGRMPEAEVAKIVAAECQRAAERARREGFALGVEHHRSECARELEDERTGVVAQASEMLRDFASERERYFSDVEEEVVQLALEIAECILRRQAASDPLLLSAAVRHALGQLAASTFARFVVPERDADMWKQELARQSAAVGHLSLGSQLQIVADANMQRGDCRIEAGIGNADLGIYSQLEEIERSFFDGIALRRSKSCAEVQQCDLRIDLRPPNSGAVADSECPEAANLEFAAPDSQSLGFAPANVDGADCQASVAQQVDPTAAAEGIGGGQGLQEVEARNPPNWLG